MDTLQDHLFNFLPNGAEYCIQIREGIGWHFVVKYLYVTKQKAEIALWEFPYFETRIIKVCRYIPPGYDIENPLIQEIVKTLKKRED